MDNSFENDVKLFMVFDILGDTERTGPKLWGLPALDSRKRLEDVKNHTLDLLLIARILQKHFPQDINFNMVYDYALFHDLPEAITGDITKFEGVPDEEIKRVTNLAIDYLAENFNNIIDFRTILNNYENRVDIESKIVHMIDKVHSATTFIKYQSENHINMDNPKIIPTLRNHPLVLKRKAEGKDLADIFYEFHLESVNITDDECRQYDISREKADQIVNTIRFFAGEFYRQKLNGSLLAVKASFPQDAMQYNRRVKGTPLT